MMRAVKCRVACCLMFALAGSVTSSYAQWTNRYPKLAGYRSHLYMAGYELPVMGAGPSDPAPSPDTRSLAISARGWIWLLDLSSREARRVTKGQGMDSRPAWSPDGEHLAFVRDDGSDTSIVGLDLRNGTETVLVDTAGLDLDPTFSRDGRSLLYSSAEAGDLDLWRLELATGAKTRLTTEKGLELKPSPLPDDLRLVYLRKKRGAQDAVCLLDTRDGSTRVLEEAGIASQTRPALSPDGRSLVVNLPGAGSWNLWLRDLEGGSKIHLAPETHLALTPAWSADGADIYFVEADERQRFHVYEIAASGGEVRDVSPIAWNWGEEVGRLTITTRLAGEAGAVPARLAIFDRDGHPVLPEQGQARFDLQNGIVYSYSSCVTTVDVPPGEVRVTATHGFTAPPVSVTRTVGAGETTAVELELTRMWDPSSAGWYSGDHHIHLDWGGTYKLVPEDFVIPLQAEDVDVATPVAASLDVRIKDLEWWGWSRLDAGTPLIVFGQEVRPHFFGHTAFIGIASRFWPNYWGPRYPVYRNADILKADAHDHAHKQGGFSYYVHPVSTANPFPKDASPTGIPMELVPDAVLGDLDGLEIVCLWSDSLGTSAAWHRLLNLGLNIVPTGGSDALLDWYRSMSVGSARVYARVDGPLNLGSYMAALRAGRTFVTNGPLMQFVVDGQEAGGVVQPSSEVDWALKMWSPAPVEKIEVLVNGDVVWEGSGFTAAGEKSFGGRVKTPAGGWIAARAYGGPTAWPIMDGMPYAHSAPIWFGNVGSRDADAARRAASDLLRWMDVADARLAENYGDTPIPRIRERFAATRERLEELAR